MLELFLGDRQIPCRQCSPKSILPKKCLLAAGEAFRDLKKSYIVDSGFHDIFNAMKAKHAQFEGQAGEFVFKSTFPSYRRSFFAESGNKIPCLSLLVGDGCRSFVPAFDF